MAGGESVHGVNLEHWPVMIVGNTAEEGDGALVLQFAELARLYKEKPMAYINVIDATNGKAPTAKMRKMIADFGNLHQSHEMQFCKGKAFVFTNPMIRGIMVAVLWMRSSTVPTQVFKTIPEAIAWGREQLWESLVDDGPAL
jgi:hypothetical protein